ncbi:MAG: glycoside hydrolase family 38 C-terminal domain-containing protein [Thermoproteota archaeon]
MMKKPVVHVISQSHIDIAWLWPYYPETIHDCVKLTFTRAVDNLKMHNEYTFAQSQVPLYKAAEEFLPELFSEIARHVKEGRWDIVGGAYVEFEGGEPCGESLARQYLFGQRYFIGRFGVKVKVEWLPDSWTIPWQLPQILKKSGINYLVFYRGSRGEDLFWWEAPDGSRILACRPPKGSFAYRPFPKMEELVSKIHGKYGVENIPIIIGSGDHGGGPTYQEIRNIQYIKEALKPEIEVCFSTPHRFFQSLSQEASGLPVLKGELDWELVGDLTNCAKLKERNRLSEVKLLTAEKFASIAMLLADMKYPQFELNSAWEKVLFNQFHDIIGGSVIPSGQAEAVEAYDAAFKTAEEALEEALRGISSLIDTSDSELSIVVFNSLSWSRTDLVETELNLPEGWRNIMIEDPDGTTVPFQVIERCKEEEETRLKIIFIAEDVPPLGYRVYRVIHNGENNLETSPVRASDRELENGFFNIRISEETGNLESIFDKENTKELLKESCYGNVLKLIEDPGDSEGRLIPGIDRSNRFPGSMRRIESKESIQVTENGSVRARLIVRRVHGYSRYVQEIAAYSRIKRVDFRLTVDWNEVHTALKVEFPLNITSPVLNVGIPYGSSFRVPNGEEQPFQQWIDISETDESYGIALLSDTKYGYDSEHNVLRLTLLRSPTEPSYNTDRGTHVVKYALYPHTRGWKTGSVTQKSYEFSNPLIAILERKHSGVLGKVGSFISVEPKDTIIECVKKAEDDQSLILRLFEHMGVKNNCEILLNLNKTLRKAYKTNILEDEVLEEVKVYGNRLSFSLNPYEICTIKIVFE